MKFRSFRIQNFLLAGYISRQKLRQIDLANIKRHISGLQFGKIEQLVQKDIHLTRPEIRYIEKFLLHFRCCRNTIQHSFDAAFDCCQRSSQIMRDTCDHICSRLFIPAVLFLFFQNMSLHIVKSRTDFFKFRIPHIQNVLCQVILLHSSGTFVQCIQRFHNVFRQVSGKYLTDSHQCQDTDHAVHQKQQDKSVFLNCPFLHHIFQPVIVQKLICTHLKFMLYGLGINFDDCHIDQKKKHQRDQDHQRI